MQSDSYDEFNKAVTLQKQGELDEAIEIYDKITKADDKFFNAFFNKAIIYYDTNYKGCDFDKAMENANQALQLKPDDIGLLLIRVNMYQVPDYKNHSFEKAMLNLDMVIEIDKEYIRAYLQKAIIYTFDEYEGKDQTKSMANFDKIIELDPKYQKAYYYRGNIFQDKLYEGFDLDKAVTEFEKAIELDPHDQNALNFQTGIYQNKEYKRYDLKKSMSFKLQQIELDTEKSNHIQYYNQALLFMNPEFEDYNLVKAMEGLEQAIKIKEDFALGYANMAPIFMDGSYPEYSLEKAIATLDKASELDPTQINVYLNKASIYLDKSYKGISNQLALENVNKALELDPNIYMAYHIKSSVLMNEKFENFDLNEAMVCMNRAIQINSKDARNFYNRALLYQTKKFEFYDLQQARLDHERALKIEPNHLLSNFLLGEILANNSYTAKDLVLSKKYKEAYLNIITQDLVKKQDIQKLNLPTDPEILKAYQMAIDFNKERYSTVFDSVVERLEKPAHKFCMKTAKDGQYIYHDLSVLGYGAFGSVYQSGDINNDDTVALKIIKRDKLAGADKNESLSLIGEIQKLSMVCGLNSPFLIKLVDYFEDFCSINIVTEYCNEGEFQKKVSENNKNPGFSIKDCLKYLYQIACGLADQHSKGIAHLDLKPENVFIKNGILMIGDYGLSMTQEECDNYTGPGFGTPGYWSPEAFNKQIKKSTKSDIWAFGCIAHYILFGKKYWYAESHEQMCYLLNNGEYNIPDKTLTGESVGIDLKIMLTKCHIKDPEKRISAANLMKDMVFNFYREEFKLKLKNSLSKIPFIDSVDALLTEKAKNIDTTQTQSYQSGQSFVSRLVQMNDNVDNQNLQISSIISATQGTVHPKSMPQPNNDMSKNNLIQENLDDSSVIFDSEYIDDTTCFVKNPNPVVATSSNIDMIGINRQPTNEKMIERQRMIFKNPSIVVERLSNICNKNKSTKNVTAKKQFNIRNSHGNSRRTVPLSRVEPTPKKIDATPKKVDRIIPKSRFIPEKKTPSQVNFKIKGGVNVTQSEPNLKRKIDIGKTMGSIRPQPYLKKPALGQTVKAFPKYGKNQNYTSIIKSSSNQANVALYSILEVSNNGNNLKKMYGSYFKQANNTLNNVDNVKKGPTNMNFKKKIIK